MEVMIEKSLQVKDTLFNPDSNDKTAYYYKGDDGKARYKVWIYLDGRDIPYVDYVTYKLHPTFPNPIKKVKRSISNANCALVIWAWGTFKTEIQIHLKDGTTVRASHNLSFDHEIKENIKYLQVNPQ
jgi:transcription initiation factor IIF auxiliary subunit